MAVGAPGMLCAFFLRWDIMKVTFIGHAVLSIEVGSITIISDPWWIGPCFGVQWWQWPRPWSPAIDGLVPDFIYISHGHNDHLHPGTLRRLPKSATVLVSQHSGVADAIERLGFRVMQLPSEKPTNIAPGVTIEIIDTDGGDTMMVVSDGREVLVNANDAVHVAPEAVQKRVIAHVAEHYGKIDYLFLGYGTASSFPNCHFIPGKENAASAAKRQAYFNAAWSSLVAKFNPRFGFPFAASVVLLEEDLIWSNEPVHNADRPTERFKREHPSSPVEVCDIAPGFTVIDGHVTDPILFKPILRSELQREMALEIRKANEVSDPQEVQIEALCQLVRANIGMYHDYLAEFASDYRVLVRLKQGTKAIEITKRGKQIACDIIDEPADPSRYDVVFTTRFSYLRRALMTLHGYEILTVGSGGTWQYQSGTAVAANIYSEISQIIRKIDGPRKSRLGDQPRWMYELKTLAKRLLARSGTDLYDLREWTVFER